MASQHNSAATAAAGVAPLTCSAVLTHHWLVRRRGGEKVLAALRDLLPISPVYTLIHDSAAMPGDWPAVHTSWLQGIPGATRHYPKLLPLMPGAARRIKLPPVELVLCSDAAIAKAMTPAPQSRVVCYCHSPMRYVWEPDISAAYRATLPALLRPLWGTVCRRVRAADLRAARRVDQFVANSRHVADRIRRHYQRDALVVYPPVDLPAEPGTEKREDFYLAVGHHVAYKRLDLAVQACQRLGRRLAVIGTGPDVDALKSRGGANVQWLGWQSDGVVQDHYRRARGLIFAGEEDFGIVPVEAIAHGCPVIAYGVGGATETVTDGVTGVLFPQQEPDALVAALRRAETLTFDAAAMFADAQRFSRARFLRAMKCVIDSALTALPQRRQ